MLMPTSAFNFMPFEPGTTSSSESGTTSSSA
jgi:hypothetical protein